jgi:hypothetical protein
MQVTLHYSTYLHINMFSTDTAVYHIALVKRLHRPKELKEE